MRSIDARVERAYLENASAVTFTAQQTTARYAASYPALAPRFHTLENAFDVEATEQVADTRTADTSEPLSLCFFGRFRKLSSAAPLIEVLSVLRRMAPQALNMIRVRMAGPLEAKDEALARDAGVLSVFAPFAPVAAFEATRFFSASRRRFDS